MPYAEMYEVTNIGIRYGYLVCTEYGNYFLRTSDSVYSPFCLDRIDVSQLKKPYSHVSLFSNALVDCVLYYNNLRANGEWERNGYLVD